MAVDCPEGWTKFEGRCYSLVTNYHDITVCRDHCRAQGGDLASIHSQRENDFVANFIQSRPSRGGEKVTIDPVTRRLRSSRPSISWSS